MTMIGEYPCCGGSLFLNHPEDRMPSFAPEDCPHCGAKVWHQFSRIWPMSFTEADFLAEFEVDHEKHTIRRRPGVEPSSPVLDPWPPQDNP
jgi:hypothetical protein